MMKHKLSIINYQLSIICFLLFTGTIGSWGQTEISSLSDITDANGSYTLASNFSTSGTPANGIGSSSTNPFKGTIDGCLVTITGTWNKPLFDYVEDATIKNVIIQEVSVSTSANAGAIAANASGATRIYNCGILGGTVGGSDNVGGLVGTLSGNARVINCYSYANITGGSIVAGIVGNIGYGENQTIIQSEVGSKGMVMNCMFYGDITGGSSIYPVYGGASGAMIKNDANNGVNPYCYFRKEASFHNKTNLPNIDSYKRSWPAEEKNLTRFEYYRSILNSNKRLCTYWVTDKVYGSADAPTEADEVKIAKWVLDPGIAPYPILKPWGKYPSVINLDPINRFNPETKAWESRSTANEWEGKSYGTLSVTISAGAYGSGSDTRNIIITDMDTLNCDYGYYKIQLPYYNEVFGDPNGTTHAAKYAGNYTDHVVTGWEITNVSGGTAGTFDGSSDHAWKDGFNFADRNCTDKDKYSVSGRVFAQGGYYYVPKDVSGIAITAHWGKAVYLANRGYSIDRVNVTYANYKSESAFAPAGTVANTFQGQPVYNDLQTAIKALDGTTTNSNNLNQQVYDQAIVLIGNHQVKNGSNKIGYSLGKWYPHTIMSADFDFDNEPDYCLELQFRNGVDRPGIQPVRFDFLPVVELGLAVRHNQNAYAIGIFVPQGHFEITETAFMRTTQFEYDGAKDENYRVSGKSPVIINGGEFEMFNVRYHNADRTSYFLLGGKAWIHRFAPGAHPNSGSKPTNELCVVNAIGGEYPEFYLSGIYRPELGTTNTQAPPHCYTNGGKFGIMAGAGYDKVKNGVTFKINHSLIGEFYGGGINGSNPIGGNIDVTIDYSRVNKYCGGPKVGDMSGKTVTTQATGTTFGVFYGGGNGGNSYYRQMQDDGDWKTSDVTSNGIINDWNHRNYHWNSFNPLGVKDDGTDNKGYHAEYEFEVFNQSNGVDDQITQRGFIRWIQFGITTTGNVSNTLNDCIIENNCYGGGNLATVSGDVSSTLTNTEVNGSVFGAGYSATIPTFQVQDKSQVSFPSIDFAGTITDGYIPYAPTVYEWTNEKLEGKDEAYMKAHPTYQKDDKWYCYTWNSLENLGTVTGSVTLNVNGNTVIEGNVFDKDGNVIERTGGAFGGGDASAALGDTKVNIEGDASSNIYNVFGGGNKADVSGDVEVNIKSGVIGKDVYGGGALANTNVMNTETTPPNPLKTTKVNLTGGTVTNNVYGGGLGKLPVGTEGNEGYVAGVEAKVYGNVTVELNKDIADEAKGCIVKGNIFGCNNLNGTPKGDVTVHIYKTQNVNATRITNPAEGEQTAKVVSRYDVNAVYGGGNLASYEPTDLINGKTNVIIDGCDRTSIRQVYGGGNAASTPATSVTVNGTYEIYELFGGGNGKDDITVNGVTKKNPGANVGFRDYSAVEDDERWDTKEERETNTDFITNYVYGSGNAGVNIFSGTIHRVFGGSNTKGNVRKTAVTLLDEQGDCAFVVDEAYGGGKSAPMDAEAQLLLACIPGLKAAYGGAEAADIHSNVTLNITNGTFDRVFGGNNISGTIDGSIKINIEETGCKPVIIGELYGGGNRAAYSIYGYKQVTEGEGNEAVTRWVAIEDANDPEALTGDNIHADPQVNVKSFTSIGSIYGGGYGTTAVMVGNPTVNINEVVGTPATRPTTGNFDENGFKGVTKNIEDHTVTLPSNKNGKIGAIGNVFGGGNAAKVIGNTHVNIATLNTVDYVTKGSGETTPRTGITVVGADIRGNVYGGGNAAEVTGDTHVEIGNKNP